MRAYSPSHADRATSPSHAYAKQTLHGVFARLLRGVHRLLRSDSIPATRL